MFAQFYHQLIRKYVTVFGTLFNDITVARLDKDGNVIQRIAVPIAYGPKQKWLVRLAQDPNLNQETAITLPRLGFEITGMTYNANRKLTSTHKNKKIITTTDKNVKSQFVPVPYDINFLLSVFCKNADDGTQIIEQIVPYFSPEWTVGVNLVPEMGIKMDTPYILNDVAIEDTYESDFMTRRALIWNLNFTCKAYLYGPVSTTGIIKRAIVDFKATDDETELKNG